MTNGWFVLCITVTVYPAYSHTTPLHLHIVPLYNIGLFPPSMATSIVIPVSLEYQGFTREHQPRDPSEEVAYTSQEDAKSQQCQQEEEAADGIFTKCRNTR